LTTTTTPNPGSKEALEQGCKCPVIDNGHGIRGSYWGTGVWIYNCDCPLHEVADDD